MFEVQGEKGIKDKKNKEKKGEERETGRGSGEAEGQQNKGPFWLQFPGSKLRAQEVVEQYPALQVRTLQPQQSSGAPPHTYMLTSTQVTQCALTMCFDQRQTLF